MSIKNYTHKIIDNAVNNISGVNIQEFLNLIGSNQGLVPINKYKVKFTAPKETTGFFKSLDVDFSRMFMMFYFCESVQLPGRSLLTFENKLNGNASVKLPYQSVYEEINLTFITSAKSFYERKFFDCWQHEIQNPVSNRFNFPNEYRVIMTISQLDSTGKEIYKQNLYDAYPISINPQELAYGTFDDYQKITVQFAYDIWLNEGLRMAENINKNKNDKNIFDKNNGIITTK